MRYVTHQFAHLETLSIARRWLVQLGFDPGQIEIHTDGIPRIAVAVRPEQAVAAEMVINAAELTDPDSWPSFWDVAQQRHIYPEVAVALSDHPFHHARTTAIGWHPEDRETEERLVLNQIRDVMSSFE
jgi:hypothetical protein